MESIQRNGISAITAATLLAIRPISQSPIQNIETGNHDASGRSMSLCGLIDNEGNVGMSKIMESKNNSRKAENTMSCNLESQDRKASVSGQTEKESQQFTYDSLENMVSALINIYATLLVCIPSRLSPMGTHGQAPEVIAENMAAPKAPRRTSPVCAIQKPKKSLWVPDLV